MPQLLGAERFGASSKEQQKPAEAEAEAKEAAATAEQAPAQEGVAPAQSMVTNKGATGEPESEPSPLMLWLLCAVSMLEGVDTQLLPASMFALQRDIGFELTDLAYLTVAQGVSINLAAPIWGILADRGILKRRSILVIGSVGQGIVTIALATTTALWSMVVLRAIVGALLAALRPISNGIIADVTSEGKRGKVFGRVQCSLLVGMFLSTMIVGNLSRKSIIGLHGWRVAFGVIGLLAMTVAVLVMKFLQEPELKQQAAGTVTQQGRRCSWFWAIVEEMRDLAKFLTIPTFCVMIMQGIFGTIPWTVMGNMMLYFQLSGLEDSKASLLTGEQPVAGAFGNLLGGYVADFLARKLGYHGRPLSAQITVAVGIPLIWLIFGGLPAGSVGFGVYFALIAGFGLLGSWAQSGTNFPILSEIVPADSRSRVMAWECALENSIANLLGPPVVTLLATKAFGYTFSDEEADGQDLASAAALGKAMQATICIPWLITLGAYTLLHWSYPRDVKRLEEREGKAAQK